MLILTIRTDKPETELDLYKSDQQLAQIKWQAHRELAETIHIKIQELLNKSSISLDQIEGIVCFKGPGSFTGLRIGLSVANALAYAQNIPIVAAQSEKWIEEGVKDLTAGKNDKITVPFYDHAPNTTRAKK